MRGESPPQRLKCKRVCDDNRLPWRLSSSQDVFVCLKPSRKATTRNSRITALCAPLFWKAFDNRKSAPFSHVSSTNVVAHFSNAMLMSLLARNSLFSSQPSLRRILSYLLTLMRITWWIIAMERAQSAGLHDCCLRTEAGIR